MKAARLAPDAVLLPADFDAYRHYSRLFKAAVAGIARGSKTGVSTKSNIDLSELSGDTLTLARRIKQAVREAPDSPAPSVSRPTSCCRKSVRTSRSRRPRHPRPGRAPEPDLAAAVAQDKRIGPKATEKLAALGIATIGDLARAEPAFLQTHFGLGYAAWLHAAANASTITR